MTKFILPIAVLCILTWYSADLRGQEFDPDLIKQKIESYKKDIRGPYKDIRWFCKNGSVLPPKEPCPEPGGVQRARYKEEVVELGDKYHLYFGQILATTDVQEFWDEENRQSRLKQYLLEQYLRSVDDGWINRKAQYYRGAYQIEDEKAWGQDFLKRILASEQNIEEYFFLIRQAVKVIPHRADNDRAQRIRAVSKVIAEDNESFMSLRIKIHGQPSQADIKAVQEYQTKNASKLNAKSKAQLTELIDDLKIFYAPFDFADIEEYLKELSDSKLRDILNDRASGYTDQLSLSEKVDVITKMLMDIRLQIKTLESRTARLVALDLSLALEEELFKLAGNWNPETITEFPPKIIAMGRALTGAGFLELWEWEAIRKDLENAPSGDDRNQWKLYLDNAKRIIEWSANMSRAVFGDVVERYQTFEPKAYGYLDDIIRGSVLLNAGQMVGTFGELLAKDDETRNYILGFNRPSTARGLNPGTATGELMVIRSATEDMTVDKNKIYVFDRPPSDLKPVAGIATVSEGNMVSHVQLLARNLAIPNAVISSEQLDYLAGFEGRSVYYQVDKSGNVLIKLADEMTDEERTQFTKKERSLEKVMVPVDRINLDERSILNMRAVDAKSSGVVSGPKAANLGQLKNMFPDQVVEGLVIPFGIFRMHMDQEMPGGTESYWQFLNNIFSEAAEMEKNGKTSDAIEAMVLSKLDILRKAIEQMPLKASFIKELENKFTSVLKGDLGDVPVFLRSDTNMEDLKDFTGAGLNLTLFNIVDRNTILEGIKKVWASPYTERSFKWRQRYLLNPENVFPSILIIPSVDVEYSGVLITKGIITDQADDLTLAISRGAGGAVDGQAAEAYLLKADGSNHLLTPAREPYFRRLPKSGGTSKMVANFNSPIATPADLNTIRDFALEVERTFPSFAESSSGAYDVEFGFQEGKLWLFQIRPFVEQKEPETPASTSEVKSEETNPLQPEGNLLWWILGGAILLVAFTLVWYFMRRRPESSVKV
jgi:hypothetical protein